MAKLNIPSIGTKLELTEEWLFPLYCESINEKFWDSYNIVFPETEKRDPSQFYIKSEKFIDCSLPAGTILTLDRIYVRKGKSSLDSVSFLINKCPTKGIRGRFLVRLEDANTLVYKD